MKPEKAAKAGVEKILFFTLSNLGDVLLTLPVLDALKARYPDARITAMIGPRPREVLEGSRSVDRLIVYDKYMPLREKARLFGDLRREKFDVVIDLRNTLYGALLPARFKTSPFLVLPRQMRHMRDRNLYRLQKALTEEIPAGAAEVKSFWYEASDQAYVQSLLSDAGVKSGETILLISHGTGGVTRRWPQENFSELCRRLHTRFRIIFIGAREHSESARRIIERSQAGNILDFTGLTSLRQLAYLMTRAACVLTGDTGTTHIASYVNAPLVVLCGPGDDRRYGPWSDRSAVVARQIFCRPCQEAQCRYSSVECMRLIRPDEVIRRLEELLAHPARAKTQGETVPLQRGYERILVCRTDRIGDVVLSTPVFEVLRQAYPNAFIAALIAPQSRDIVEANPFIDRVVVYDKKGRHRGLWPAFGFIRALKRERFDCAFVLHPTNRMHLVTWAAGIPRRFGYDRKLGFLLTRRVAHEKQRGEKHEAEYNFDILRAAGIEAQSSRLFMPVDKEAEAWAEEVLRPPDPGSAKGLLAIHPAASCTSKIWSAGRFAELADALVERYRFRVVVVATAAQAQLAAEVVKKMRHPALDLSGQTSIARLASVLRRSRILVSNDSGPVHIAAAVGTPVVAIFGRKQAGLSSRRWGPLGQRSVSVQRDVGCIECLAHHCRRQFACLEAIGVKEVMAAAESLL